MPQTTAPKFPGDVVQFRPLNVRNVRECVGYLQVLRCVSHVDVIASDIFASTMAQRRRLGCHTWVALDKNGAVIGTISLEIRPTIHHAGRPMAYIEDLIIHPEHRNQGIGRYMLRFMIQMARNDGCAGVCTEAMSESAARFCEREEFEVRPVRGMVHWLQTAPASTLVAHRGTKG